MSSVPPRRMPRANLADLALAARDRLSRWLPPAGLWMKHRAYGRQLQQLSDAIHGTPLDGRYWIVGGLLLGWARAGRPLDSDLEDADFAYLDQDHDRFLATVPSLVAAGFQPRHRFTSADSRHVEHRFRRGGVQFDFFRLSEGADCFRYSMFVRGERPMELIAEVPAQERVPLRYLGRSWLKVADHDLALRSIYGDWRTDRPDWSYTSDRAIVERIPMPLLPLEWNWPGEQADGRP